MITGPTTEIEIISNAATLCGKAPFSTLDDGGTFALSAKKMFDMITPFLLAAPHWRFNVITRQLQLIANFDPDIANWQFAWQIPADFLSLIRVDPLQAFQIYGDQIYTLGQSPMKLEYRTQLPVSKWPVYFRHYAAFELAILLAFSVAESEKLEQKLKEERVEVRALAMYVDAQNHPSDPIQDNPWITVRAGMGGYTGIGW
jgi:hypothetical protein